MRKGIKAMQLAFLGEYGVFFSRPYT